MFLIGHFCRIIRYPQHERGFQPRYFGVRLTLIVSNDYRSRQWFSNSSLKFNPALLEPCPEGDGCPAIVFVVARNDPLCRLAFLRYSFIQR